MDVKGLDEEGNVVEDDSVATKWQILLDGRPAKTLGMGNLTAPTRQLAVAVAAEFGTQRDLVHPASTPLYNLLSNALDRFPEETDRFKLRMEEFLETDNVCYRVGNGEDLEDPRDVMCFKRQEKYYRPLIDWFEKHYGGPLDVVSGIRVPEHPFEVTERVIESLSDVDPYLMSAAGQILDSTKSTVITLALLHRFINVDQAFHASRVEEEHQIEQGGFVYDGHDTQRVNQRVRLSSASVFLWLNPDSCLKPLKPLKK